MGPVGPMGQGTHSHSHKRPNKTNSLSIEAASLLHSLGVSAMMGVVEGVGTGSAAMMGVAGGGLL